MVQNAEGSAADSSAEMVEMRVNGVNVKVPEGSTILDACRAAGVSVPTLCNHRRLPTVGICRVCLVETSPRPDRFAGRSRVARQQSLVAACQTPAASNWDVTTDSPRVRESICANLTMVLRHHPRDCLTCEANGDCHLQDLVQRYGLENHWKEVTENAARQGHGRTLDGRGGSESLFFLGEWDDSTTPALRRDMDKCIKCGRCIRACSHLQGLDILGWVERGSKVMPAPAYDLPLSETACIQCGQCAAFCPTGAIVEKPTWRTVLEELENVHPDRKHKVHIAQTAPATRIGIGEEMGLDPGDTAMSAGRMVSSLRKLGFDYVFDTQFTADLTILEEGHELLGRLGLSNSEDSNDAHPGPLPMFTSCCPGWVNLVEKSYPQWIPNLSSCRSPQGMMSALIKRYYSRKLGLRPEEVSITSIMPCTAKKDEAARRQLHSPDGKPDTDYVITTRELGRLLRSKKIHFASLEEDNFDDPLGLSTGAGTIFGVTGGVMEAALRTAHYVVTGKEMDRIDNSPVRGLHGVKEADVPVGEHTVRVAVVHGTGNTRLLLEALERKREGLPQPPEVAELNLSLDYHFVEVMACLGGCIGGGGQPKSEEEDILARRMKAIYELDKNAPIRQSHRNPAVLQLYEDLLGKPLGSRSHNLLHTTYQDRSSGVVAKLPPLST